MNPGPVHEYVAPATAGVLRFKVLPGHSGPLLLAVGVAGVEFTDTVVVAAGPVHPLVVIVALYVPAIASVALVITGFWVVELKPLGPDQVNVVPVPDAVRLIVPPVHTGELEDTVGAAGIGLTVAVTVPFALVQPLTVAFTV